MSGADELTVERRWVLGTIGAGAVIGLTGCLGDEDNDDGNGGDDGNGSDDGENGDDGGNGEEGENGEENGEEELTLEPVDVPEDAECAVCSMMAADYPDWNGQVVHEDEHREFTCSTGCLVAYYYAPERFTSGDPEEPIAGIWATSFESGEFVDANEAYFVYEQDRERQDFPMPMGSPLAFEDRDDAVAYVEEYDDLTEDEHVITLEDVDEDVVMFYRAPRFEDDEDDENDTDDHDGEGEDDMDDH